MCGLLRDHYIIVISVDSGSDTGPIGPLLVVFWPLKKSILAMNIATNGLAFEDRLDLKVISFGIHYLDTCRGLQGGDDFSVRTRAAAQK
jgi:hypothetical protein